ncbi:unnamed protein product [Sphacelaria rigidula]
MPPKRKATDNSIDGKKKNSGSNKRQATAKGEASSTLAQSSGSITKTPKPTTAVSKSKAKAKSEAKSATEQVSGSCDGAGSSGAKTGVEAEIPKRNKQGQLVFPDHPKFRPNLTPKEVMQMGSFGGSYFRPIRSSVTNMSYKDVWKEFPSDWFEGLNIKRQVANPMYLDSVNKYGVGCGGDLHMWESSGWMRPCDPYGWFQWYCRFYLGRRCDDDDRQISRGLKV